jgi:hypothetical protein
MNKIEFALKLAKYYTYADDLTEGAKEYLRKGIDKALKQVKNCDLPDGEGANDRLPLPDSELQKWVKYVYPDIDDMHSCVNRREGFKAGVRFKFKRLSKLNATPFEIR